MAAGQHFRTRMDNFQSFLPLTVHTSGPLLAKLNSYWNLAIEVKSCVHEINTAITCMYVVLCSPYNPPLDP